MYTTFEEESKKQFLSGRSLVTLELDKVLRQLVSHAKSVYGRELCEQILPCTNIVMVEQLQQETDDAVIYLQREGQLPLSGFSEIRDSIALLRANGTLSMKSLLEIAGFLRAVDRLKKVLPNEKNDSASSSLFARIRMLMQVSSLEKELSFCILSEDEMNDRASDKLYQIRRSIREAQSNIRDVLERIIRSHPTALQEQLVTLRGERYVVPVKAEKRGEIPGIIHDTSSSGQTIFVEPIAVVEANNKIREWLSQEREEIERILAYLSGRVEGYLDELMLDVKLVSELDLQNAKASLSLSMRATRPILNENGRISLRKARHPLISKEKVVPIDFSIGDKYRTLVVTGPNTGGKTVSLKTCGLCCLMAMSGLQIPCLDHSEVSVFERVLADIGDEQSIEQSLSTFSSHMKNLVYILENTRESTLVLVDELGSGTDPSEGAALAIAILDYLRRQGAVTVATTHYKELKGYAIETEGAQNACCEFDTETLSPTYRLLIGLPGVSNAFAISKKLGLPQDIINDAQLLLSEEGLRFEELLSSAEQNNRESEKLRKEIRDMRDHVKSREEELSKEKEAWEKKRQLILQEAREEKKCLLSDALEEADQMLKEFRRSVADENKLAVEEKAKMIRQNLRAGMQNIDDENEQSRASIPIPGEIPDEIRSGGSYYSPSLNVIGIVVSGPDSRGKCILQSGSMRVSVMKDSLRYPLPEPKSEVTGGTKKGRRIAPLKNGGNAEQIRVNRASSTMPEVMLIGMKVDEALETLDHYIDDCYLSNIMSVRIVHGKGTGALRAAVTNSLKQDKRISKFRLGTFGEGEDGVTIAELK